MILPGHVMAASLSSPGRGQGDNAAARIEFVEVLVHGPPRAEVADHELTRRVAVDDALQLVGVGLPASCRRPCRLTADR